VEKVNIMDKSKVFPIGDSIQMSRQNIDPYPMFGQLLEREPVSWIGEIDMWYVTRREDVLRILADTDTFTVVSEKSLMRQAVGTNMITTDGVEQARLRRPFNTSFAPRGIREFAEPFIASVAHELIDSFADQDVVDIKAEYADIIAIKTIVEILGLNVEDYAQIRKWVFDFSQIMSNFAGDESIIKQGKQSVQEFTDYVQVGLDELRQHSDDSVLGKMMHSPHHQLTDTELIDSVKVIIFGGVETTSALIASTLSCLLTRPEQLTAVRENPDTLLSNAIEEVLRYESPVQTCTRHVLRDVEVAGVMLSAGDTLQCMLGAANRDPSHFNHPNQFDIHRDNADNHLAFANGKHFCIGAGLARMEANISLNMLLDHFPDLQLAFPDEDVPLGYEFRAPHQLRLNIT
jgi:cytochrome P450